MKLTGLTVVVPDYPRSIDDDLSEFDNDAAKLARAKKQIGFGIRYNCPPGCTSTDLTVSATELLLKEMAISAETIDALICVMQRPDHTEPGSSFIIHKKLGLPKSCACLDINQGCPGFIYGLWIAGSLLESGACRRVILTTADVFDSPSSRNRLLFGDAGTAALIEFHEHAGPSFFNLCADGNHHEAIIRPANGARLPIGSDLLELEIPVSQGGSPIRLINVYLNGLEVFNFSIGEVPTNVKELLAFAGIKPEDLDFAAFHQANKQIVDHIASKVGLSKTQYSTRTFSEYGNQSSASVPGVIAHILAPIATTTKLKVLLCGYGIGAAWASCITELDCLRCSGVTKLKYTDLPSREDLIKYWKSKIGGI
jgi:3-oxoacyl-[acyl-carrier-protein] synthase-3